MDALEYRLPRNSVSCDVMLISINACKHTALIPSSDLCLKRFDNLVPCLLARDSIIAMILLAKNDLNFTKVFFFVRDKGYLKTRLELMRGNLADISLGECLFALSLHEVVVQMCFLHVGLVLHC